MSEKCAKMLAALCLMVMMVVSQCVYGQMFPRKPIKLITGGAPGSVTDSIARPLAEKLSSLLPQPVIVENRPGAGGILAMDLVAKARPDGYTVGIATMSQLVFNSYLFAKLPYNPLHDFRPVAGLVSGPIAVAVNASVAANSFRDLVVHVKAHPDELRYAIPQLGSPPHIVGLLVLRAAEIEMSAVPFKSATEALRSVLSGDVPVLLEAPPIIAEHVRSGKLKALAVTGRHRDRLLPETPTLEEQGFSGIQGDVWIGLVAPAATPDDVIARLNTDNNEALRSFELKEYLDAAGWRSTGGSAEAFASAITESHALWGKLIREAGLHLD